MVKTSDIIKLLKEKIPKVGLITFATFGSQPKDLIPGTDLDLILIIESITKDNYFDQLIPILESLSDNNLEYTLINGPYKSENKGLLHFHVYTDEKCPTPSDVWNEENTSVRLSILKKHKLILGKSLKVANILTEKIDQEAWYQKKVIELSQTGTIKPRCWYKENGTWVVSRKPITLTDWQTKNLKAYYEKHRKN